MSQALLLGLLLLRLLWEDPGKTGVEEKPAGDLYDLCLVLWWSSNAFFKGQSFQSQSCLSLPVEE